MQVDGQRLTALLKQYFGFSEFRPLQEQIIRDSLAGRDVFALLPTGGGKSLCFQLPALLRGGLTVVVSPLIALMKDQVDAMEAAGVPATFLNSTLAPDQARSRLARLHAGQIRLLYVAPERLMLPGFLEDLARWKVELFAIDEAHCISEWGHDFRPEYRRLLSLRDQFPGVPIMALTATATGRVREDIVNQLRLRDAALYLASFNRPNLHYRVTAKERAYEQILTFTKSRPDECGIIYCQSRKTADSVASRLQSDGVAAAPYHAGMDSGDRAKNQEAFLRDEVRVICATIAFGMGINKPNVRYVIHHDMPKNLEGYYQETGRAGRDGLPSECLLLFSSGDRVKYSKFIDEIPDEHERQVARGHLDRMVHYAEGADCRRQHLLRYFGEEYPDANCAGCDNCQSPRESWDGTLAAQKFLSCVYRIKEKSGFGVGINHVAEVLTGSKNEKVSKWGHESLSTHGIGTEFSRENWSLIGRELVRLGFLNQQPPFSVLELTAGGRAVLKARQPVSLTARLITKQVGENGERGRSGGDRSRSSRAGEIECDEVLFGTLRNLRKKIADAEDLPAYIIFSDVSLRQMARYYPCTDAEFARISGVGERKLAQFGRKFTAAIVAHLENNPRLPFPPGAVSVAPVRPVAPGAVNDTAAQTLAIFKSGRSVEEIAASRSLAPSTIYGHLLRVVEAGQPLDLARFIDADAQAEITAAAAKFGWGNLAGIYEALEERFHFDLLRICRVLMQRAAARE